MDHRLGLHQPALHAARQRARIGLALSVEPHRREQCVRNALVLGHAVKPCLDLPSASYGVKKGSKTIFLRNDADRIFGIARIGVDVEAPDGLACPLVLLTTSPARMLISVDLPAPFGPSSPKIWPRGTSKPTLSSACLPPVIEFGDGVDADGGFTQGGLHSRAPARAKAFSPGSIFAQRRVNVKFETRRYRRISGGPDIPFARRLRSAVSS